VYFVAVERGFLKAEGVDASYQLFDSGPAAEESVVGGQAEVTQNAELPQQLPASKGATINVVASSYHPTRNMCVMARPEIKNPQDLIGKTVTYLQLSGGQYLWTVWADKHGLLDKVKTVSLAPPEMLPAMARGDVQAAVIWIPWCDKVGTVVKGGHVLAWPGADEGLYQPDNATIFSGRIVKQNPDVGRRVLSGLIKAADWVNTHTVDAGALVAPILKLTPEDATAQLRAILPYRMRLTDEDVQSFVDVATWAKGAHLVTYPQTPQELMQQLIDPCLLKSVAPDRVTLSKFSFSCPGR
jgi:ABC-type nitrate/sulfonate/bicarbonate transport system substrate-binding protein